MKYYQVVLFGLWGQSGSDCPYIFVEHLARQRPGSLGSIMSIFFSLRLHLLLFAECPYCSLQIEQYS